MNSRNSSTNPLRRTARWGKTVAFGAALALVGLQTNAQNVEVSTGGPITNYTTLGAAFTAINAGTHTGAILIEIASNTTETGACVLNSSGAGSASYTSVLLRPRVDGVTISGPTVGGRGLVELNGADNVVIDGDNPNTGGTNRNLTFTNTAVNTTTFTSVIRVALSTLITSGNSNHVRNCVINGSATGRNISTATSTTGSENTTWGIIVGGGASTVAATTAPNALASVTTTIGGAITATDFQAVNNQIDACARGIAVQGSATTVAANLQVTDNVIGSATSGNTTTVYSKGMTLQGFSGTTLIARNTIRNLESFLGTFVGGISLGDVSASGTAAVVERNSISNIFNQNVGTFGAYGINVTAGASNVVRNNFIRDVKNSQVAGTGAFSTTFGVLGIRIAASTGHQVYHNTVHLSGAIPGTVSTDLVVCLGITGTGLTGCDVRNNIFSNVMTGGNPAGFNTTFSCIFLPSGGTSAMNLTLNNNAYYQGGTAFSTIGQVGTTVAGGTFTAANFNPSLTTPASNLRSYTSTLNGAGTNDNASLASTAAAPFISSTDLHIDISNPNAPALNATGATGTGVANDFDNDVRGATPDIGADEFILLTCSSADGGTIAPSAASACAGGTYVMTSTGSATGAGISNQWQFSLTPGGPYSPVIGGSGATTTTYTTGPLAAGTYYFVMTNTCSSGPVSDDSNELTLTVNPVPTASASSNSPVCAGTALNLNGTTDIGTTFSWTGPNGFASASEDPTIPAATLAAAGVYSFTATAAGCTSPVATTTVVVNPAPAITALTATPNPTCLNGNSQLNFTAGIANPSSTVGGAITINSTGNATPYPSTVTVAGLPVGGAIVKQVIINGYAHTFPNDVDMALRSPTGTSVVIMADAGGTGAVTGRNLVFQDGFPLLPTGAASGTYRCTSPDAPDNFPAPGPGSLSQISPTLASFTGNLNGTWELFIVDDATGDAGTITSWSIVFEYGAAVSTYLWTPNTFLDFDNIANPLASNINVASQAYTVQATSAAGCSATDNITVNTTGPVTSASISGTLSFCTGGSTTLTAVPADGSAPHTYLWSPGGETTASILVTAGGNYSCQVDDACGGSVNTGSVTVTVDPLPTASASSNSPVCVGNSINLTGTTDIGATFSWTGPGGFTSNAQNPTIPAAAFSNAGVYSFTAISAAGCSSLAATTSVTVFSVPTVPVMTPTSAVACPNDPVNLSAASTSFSLSSVAGAALTIPITGATGLSTPYPATAVVAGLPLVGVTVSKVTITGLHTWQNDMDVLLQSPSGQNVIIMSDCGDDGLGPDFSGTYDFVDGGTLMTAGTNVAGTYACTDLGGGGGAIPGVDQWPAPGPGTSPVASTLLTSFTGNLNGTWNLYVVDDTSIDGGSITAWSIEFTTSANITYTWSPGTGLNQTTGANVISTASAYQVYTVTASNGGCTSQNTVEVGRACNDDCADAIAVGCNSVTAGTTLGTTIDAVPTCDTPLNTAGGVWYTVVGTGGNISVALCGSGYDTKVGVFTTPDCATFTCVEGNNNDTDPNGLNQCTNALHSSLSFASTLGTTYYILVTGNGTSTGNFTMEVTCQGDGDCNDNGVVVDITTDNFGSETSWEIVPVGNTIPVCSGSGYSNNASISVDCCLLDGCYVLSFFDQFNDGMCCVNGAGGYKLSTDTGKRIIDNVADGTFTSVSSVANGFCVPIGNTQLTIATCDKEDFLINDVVVSGIDPAVSAQYGVTDATSGYQFWLFDPDGSYSRRLFRSHASGSCVGTPVGPTRAAHMKFSCLNSALPNVPLDLLLNMRVRPRIAGNYGEFGPACRVKVLSAPPACPTTKLDDNPLHAATTLSCGVTGKVVGASGNAGKLFPNIVAGANKYQYEFTYAAEGYSRTIATPNGQYALTLANWVTNPLLCGTFTYDVRVRVSFDGGANWCPYGPVCTVGITNNPPNNCTPAGAFQGGGLNTTIATEEGMNMYPNPTGDGRVTIELNGLSAEAMTANIEVFDLFGKRVASEAISTDGATELNKVMTLDNLATGMYMVHVTSGNKQFTDRLVIK